MILLLLISCARFSSASEAEVDSLYANWNHNSSTVPLVSFDLNRFKDEELRQSILGLAINYEAGLVFIEDGEVDLVKDWVDQLHYGSPVTLVAAKSPKVFELPFEGGKELPSQLMVESLTDMSLIESLAYYHADLLHAMQIQVLHYDYLPEYYGASEWQKLKLYWSVLDQEGIKLSLGNGAAAFVSQYQKELPWQNMAFLESSVLADEQLTKKRPSRKFRKESGFNGLVVERYNRSSLTDSKTNQWDSGIDILRFDNFTNHHKAINQILASGIVKKSYFKNRLKKYYKLWVQFDRLEGSAIPLLPHQLHYQFQSQSIALVKDELDYYPIRDLNHQSFYIFSSSQNRQVLHQMVNKYKRSQMSELEPLLLPVDSFSQYIPLKSHLIIDLSSVVQLDLMQEYVEQIRALSQSYKVGVLYQGTPSNLKMLSQLSTLLWTSELGANSMSLMVQKVFGAEDVHGKIPGYLIGQGEPVGVSKRALGRLKYLSPQVMDLDVASLSKIDSIVNRGIVEQMFPGCQIIMVKNGAVVYDKSFGYLTYDSLEAVQWDHLYDIASVTKTTATVPMVMQEVAVGNFEIEGLVGDYSGIYGDTDKSKLVLRDLLAHQAGLRSYVPFWKYSSFLSDSGDFYYKKQIERRRFEYLSIDWQDSVSQWIANSTFNSLQQPDSSYKYLYSDLGFMMMKDLVEENEKQSIDLLVDSLFYQPLAMDFTGFNPLDRFPEWQIAPTELDLSFRNRLLRGEVHDRNAALLGGVSGHAGLFSNSNDLAKYMQMMLQKGSYGGTQYFDGELVELFTQESNDRYKRALGWDKPREEVHNASQYASDQSFGHSGFTGTLVWADPEYDLIYIFLSNRVYPDSRNTKLIKSNTRTKIHDLMYEAILSEEKIVNQKM
ncbi:serine hydrolase domain-containing protein [Reichenbachiella ulvae]|uniref:Serine hydrolase n=1 Tax=Reichenbachiella ulvae TaxID=2980104 RepID=A0ABT3CTP4_9BACT|nr:serine hydrolase [Reichenbachiella ulvae]MCV9387072.1 serine hydrolase [Reichenbachiella ulvae]